MGLRRQVARISALADQRDSLAEHDQQFADSLLRQFTEHGDLTARQWVFVEKLAKRAKTRTKHSRTCFLYIILAPDAMKIGVSVNPKARLTELQVGNPHPLRLERTFPFKNTTAAKRAERKAHKACRKHALSGEWFRQDALPVVLDMF